MFGPLNPEGMQLNGQFVQPEQVHSFTVHNIYRPIVGHTILVIWQYMLFSWHGSNMAVYALQLAWQFIMSVKLVPLLWLVQSPFLPRPQVACDR